MKKNKKEQRIEQKDLEKKDNYLEKIIDKEGKTLMKIISDTISYNEELIKPELPSPTPTPVFTECVIGYRTWKVDALGLLRAITMTKQIWTTGVNEAKCRPNDSNYLSLNPSFYKVDEAHNAPHKDCHCGLYAYNNLTDKVKFYLSESYKDNGELYVMGAIAAWGDLQVHYDGFRASPAFIVALAYVSNESERIKKVLNSVAKEYNVPFVHLDMLQAEAEQHGTPLPANVRPPNISQLNYD